MPFNEDHFLQAARVGALDTFLSQAKEPDAYTSTTDTGGNNALMLAIQHKKFNIVQAFFTHQIYIDINEKNKQGETALSLAVRAGYTDIVELLIANGAKLHHALLEHRKFLELILAQERFINIDSKDAKGNTVLMAAALAGKDDLIPLLIARGADPTIQNNDNQAPIDIEFVKDYLQNHFCPCLFIKAAENGDLAMLKDQAKRPDFHINVVTDYPSYGDTALIRAARNGHIAVIRFLIKNGANVNHKASDGYTAIKLASEKNQPAAVRLLVEAGADQQSQYEALKMSVLNGWSPNTACYLIKEVGLDIHHKYQVNLDQFLLIWAYNGAQLPALETVELLFQKGMPANINLLGLYNNVRFNDHLQLFLRYGADINNKDTNGNTLLMRAAKDGSLLCILFLLLNGADLNLRNIENKSALEQVQLDNHVKESFPETIAFLEIAANYFPINTKNSRQLLLNHALLCTAKYQTKSTLSLIEDLITIGADPCWQDTKGQIALELIPEDKLETKKYLIDVTRKSLAKRRRYKGLEITAIVLSLLVGIGMTGFASTLLFSSLLTLTLAPGFLFTLLGTGIALVLLGLGLSIHLAINEQANSASEQKLRNVKFFAPDIFDKVFREDNFQLASQMLDYAKTNGEKVDLNKVTLTNKEEKFYLFHALGKDSKWLELFLTTTNSSIELIPHIDDEIAEGTVLFYAVKNNLIQHTTLLVQHGAMITDDIFQLAENNPQIKECLTKAKQAQEASGQGIINPNGSTFKTPLSPASKLQKSANPTSENPEYRK